MGGSILQGRKAIAEYVGRPWETIKRWIKEKGFPATNLGGRWESDESLIIEWRREQIKNAKAARK